MQPVPNWQRIANHYAFSCNPATDSVRQIHINWFGTLQRVHFQREGAINYYDRLLSFYSKHMPISARKEGHGVMRIRLELQCRKMAEEQFGTVLIGKL